ncbi:hypothetical protein, partial [Pseudomonas protegens]|uniref:hypothetical protein n=1 Tax=Pseudomonas protegens TaxID=380021 RepID=UPI001CA4D587
THLAAVLCGATTGAVGAAHVQVIAVLLVLAGNIAEAQGAGVQLEVAVVGKDQSAKATRFSRDIYRVRTESLIFYADTKSRTI